MTTIYDYTVQTADGREQSLRAYEGNVLLVVNTASKCGFAPQFEGLQQLYDTYRDRGFTVLGFSCDQFQNQEFDNMEDTLQFCRSHYGVTFPVFAKLHVNEPDEHPLYTFLKAAKPGLLNENIKWNFTKFLIGSNGEVIARYAPATEPAKIAKAIEQLLAH